jgi:predicted MFS family arabinose efflux permease
VSSTALAPDSASGGHSKGSSGYRKVLVALACAGLATFAQLYSPQGLLPLLAADLGLSADQAALTVSAATLGLAVSVLPWSFAADRFGRVRSMRAALLAACVLGLAVPFAPTLASLLVLRTLEGIALGGIPGIALAYLNEEIATRHAAAAAGAYIAGTTLGGLAGRLLAGPVAELGGWRLGVFTVAVACTAASIVFACSAPAPRGFKPGRGGGLRAGLAKLGPQLRDRRLLALYAQAFLLMGCFVSVYNYLGFRLQAPPFLLPVAAVSLIFLAYLAGTASARIGAGLSARRGRRTVLLASTALMLAGLGIMAVDMLGVLLAGLVLFTAGFFGAHSIASGWTGSLAVTGRAQAASLYNLSYYTGSSALGWISGTVFAQGGWPVLTIMLAALVVMAAAAAVIILPGHGAEIRSVATMASTGSRISLPR